MPRLPEPKDPIIRQMQAIVNARGKTSFNDECVAALYALFPELLDRPVAVQVEALVLASLVPVTILRDLRRVIK